MADFDATRALMGDADESYDSRADYWKARALAAEAENFALAASQCIHDDGLTGDEGGSQYCAKHREIERLRAERESFYMDYRMKCDEETKAQAVEIERLRVERDALKAVASLAERMLREMAAEAELYLIPDRTDCGKAWFVSRMLWWIDGPRQRELQAAIDAVRR